eukprot:g8908.t1
MVFLLLRLETDDLKEVYLVEPGKSSLLIASLSLASLTHFSDFRLWIVGQGFSEDPTSSANEVYIAGVACVVIDYLSLPGSLIVVDTPPSPNEEEFLNAAIIIRVGDEEITAHSVFHYRLQRTPRITSILPSTISPGESVLFKGDFKDRSLGGESAGFFREVILGDNSRCMLPDSEDADQTEALFYSFYCTTSLHLPIGFHNATVVVGRYYGNSQMDTSFHYYKPRDLIREAYKANLDGQRYAVQVVPRIDSISHHTGSVEGGLALTITGVGLVGNPTGESVICVTSASEEIESPFVYTGGRGVRREIFTRVTTSGQNDFESFDSRQSVQSDILPTIETETNRGSNYEQRLHTIFIPRVSGLHTFYCIVDDIADVYISSIDDESLKKTKILQIRRYTPTFLPHLDRIRSKALEMESNQRYFIEVHMAEFSGADYLTLGVSYPNPNSGYLHNSMKEVQKLSIIGSMEREIQSVKIENFLSGDFRLEYSLMNANGIKHSDFTTSLPWNASASQIYHALSALETVSEHISVSRAQNETESSVTINFTFHTQIDFQRELIRVYPNCQGQCNAKSSRIQEGSPPLQGKFSMMFGNEETSSIGIETDFNQLDSLMESQLFPGQKVTVDVYHSSSPTEERIDFYVTFNQHDGRVSDLLQLNVTGVFGGIQNKSIETDSMVLIEGSSDLMFMPIPSDMLFVPENHSQFHLYIDGSLANCAAESCTFETSLDETPVLTSVIEEFVDSGRILQISGNGFQNEVEITVGSSTPCEITSYSDEIIECSLPEDAEAGDLQIHANFTDKGLARHQGGDTPYFVTYGLQIYEVFPDMGSIAGGTHVTITGTGFANSLAKIRITIDGTSARVLSFNATVLVVETPSIDSEMEVIGLVESSGISTDFTFTYADLASLSTISPAIASTVARTELIITGTGFGMNKDFVKVKVGNNDCVLDPETELTNDQIVCDLNGGGPPGTHRVKVYIAGIGFASGDLTCTFEFEITEVSPTEGSLYGGTILTLTGRGFGSGIGLDENVVSIGNRNPPCEVLWQNYTTIVCVTGALLIRDSVDIALEVNLALRNIYADCPAGHCTFIYKTDISPVIQKITPDQAGYQQTIRVFGYQFGQDEENLIHVYLVPESEANCNGDLCSISNERLQSYHRHSVQNLNSSNFEFILDQQTAGIYRVVVYIEGTGFANSSFPLEYVSQINAIYPSEMSMNGGILTLVGSGFPPSLEMSEVWGIKVNQSRLLLLFYICIQIGSENCRILSSEATIMSCMISNHFSKNHAVSVTYKSHHSSVYSAYCNWKEVCALEFTKDKTPEILDGNVEYLDNGQIRVQLIGRGFTGSADLLLHEDIDNLNFTITEVNETLFSALLPNLPAGVHKLLLHVNGSGFATDSRRILSGIIQNLSAESPQITTGSIAGGTKLELRGIGFDIYNLSNNKVSICDHECSISDVKFDRISCKTPAFVNLEWAEKYGLAGVKKLSGFVKSSSQHRQGALFDGNVSTFFISGGSCFVELDFGDRNFANLTSVVIHPELPKTGGPKARERIVGSQIQGSLDGIEYKTLLEIDQEPPYGYSTFAIQSDEFFRFIRFIGMEDSKCRLAELELHGIKYMNDSLDLGVCNISLSVGNKDILLENSFQYHPDTTGNITDINPKSGTTAGGTEVTISGSHFSDQVEDISVIIDDTPCEIQTTSLTEISCIAGTKINNELHSFSVHIANRGYVATNGHQFLYTEKWSESSTWGGTLPPREGDSVVIPKGKHVLLDISPPQLYVIIIEGTLEFEDSQDLHLQCSYIFIRNGSLKVGTKDSPFTHKAVITLHGHPETHPELPLYGAKNIAVRHGTLDLHGQAKTPTWTMLRQTVFPGESVLKLEEQTNWNVGDQIVLASTSYDFRETEELTILQVSENGRSLTITPTLKHKHLAERLSYGIKTIEIKAEVGVLTRNVVVRGDSESANTQWGAQVMLHGPKEGTTIGHLENTEFTLCGQAFALGRYPVHFHLLHNVQDSYVRGCSIHHTFNRAVTIHGVSYFNVEDNIAYDIMGHAFFLEDGIEERNRIQNNLGLVTKASLSLLDTDATPATFWITNPSNYFVGNHAAGSERYGFWFDLPSHSTGASFSKTECPPGKPLGVFRGNLAHSNGRYGLRIFNQYVPRQNHCNFLSKDNIQNPPIPAVFEDFVSFKNKRNGVSCSLIGEVEFRNFSLADNLRTGMEVVKVNSPLGGAKTVDSLIIATTEGNDLLHELRDDPDNGSSFGFIVSGATFNYTIENTTFVNFNRTDTYVFGSCSHCNFPNNKNNDAKITSFQGISYVNSPNRVKWGFPYKHTFLDLDGSLSETGVSGAWITTDWPHLRSHCNQLTSDDGWPDSLRCSPEHSIARFAVHSQQPFSYFENDPMWIRTNHVIHSLNETNVTLSMSDWSKVPYRGKKFKDPRHGWAIPVLSGGYTYDVHWNGVDFTSLTLEASALLPGHSFYIRLNYTEYRDHFEIFVNNKEILGSTIALPLPTSQTGFSYHDVSNKTLTILFSGRNQHGFGNTQVVRVEANACPREGCPEPEYIEVEREPFIRLWSNTSQWPRNQLPQKGEDVEIQEPWRLVMDTEAPQLGTLIIKGQLSFSPQLDETILEAKNILILGGELIAGTASLPFNKRVIIRLNGDRASLPLMVHESIDAGPKSLTVLGKLKLHGQRRGVTWTRLSSSIAPLDDIIQLEVAVDWQVGEEVLVTSSSFDQNEAETGRIAKKIDDQTFQLEQPLTYAHYGGTTIETETSSPGQIVDVRAEVALLSRNIKITASQTSDKFGFHLLGGKLVSEETGRIFSGSVQLNGVELTNGGHFQTIRNTLDLIQANGTNSYIEKCSFHHNSNSAILIKDTSNIKIKENVIFDTIGSSIDVLESHNLQLEANLACLVRRRVDSPGHEVFEALGNFMICTWNVAENKGTTNCENITLNDNVAAGSYHISYAINGHGHSSNDGSYSGGGVNTAHSSRVGVLGFSTNTQCTWISGFHVHHTVEAGITMNSNSPCVVVSDVVLSDNLVGISLVPANGEDAGTTEIRNAVVIGHSDNGGCGYDKSIPCKTSTAFKDTNVGHRSAFAKPGSDSVFNGCSHRVGIMTSVFDAVSKGYPRFPPLHLFNEVKSDSGFGGTALLNNILFRNWTVLDRCGFHNSVIATNPSSSDATPVHYLRSLEFERCDEGSLIYMDSPDPVWINPEDCVDMNCTGLWNTAFVDEDGSLISSKGQIVPNYPSVFESDFQCTLKLDWNAYVCTDTSYDTLFFENLDVDRFTRRVHPVEVSNLDGTASSKLNSYMDRRWDDDYTSLLRLSRFPVIVQKGGQYFINFTGTVPRSLRFGFGNGGGSSGIIVHLMYTNPELHRVSRGASEIAVNSERLTLSDSSGAHFWNNTNRMLSLVIKEEFITVQTINAVQVSLTLTATIDEFYDQGGTVAFTRNIAYTLNIPMSRIRVVEVVSIVSRRRSTRLLLSPQVTVEFAVVEDETNTTTNSQKELVALSEEITMRAEANTLLTSPPGEDAFLLEIFEVSVLLSLPPESPCIPSCKNREVDNELLPAKCFDGVCKCLTDGHSYIQHTSADDLLNDNQTSHDDGCYQDEQERNSSNSKFKTVIVVVCIIVGLILIGIGGVIILKCNSRRKRKELLFQNNPVFSDDGTMEASEDRIKVALPKISSSRRTSHQQPAWHF